ncbi:MAG: CBS domain-containing protein [Oscillospiraceae bacterium]|nr:CBS domain-containing protein [Oscillospiraceae bacterium]
MKLRDIMTSPVIRIDPQESVAVAARTLTHYNIGVLPVCGSDGRICGLVTDRDIVTRCLAAGRQPGATTVQEIMTRNVIAARPDTDAGVAAQVMGKQQIRRLPVVENEKLCGMVSIGDLANCDESAYDAGDALAEISNNVSSRN